MHIMHAVYDSVMSPRYSKIYFLQSILEMANHFSYSFFHPHFLSVFSTAQQCDIIGEPGLDAHSIHGESHCTFLPLF